MALKENLVRLREQAGYKQAKDFAKAAGIPYSSYIVYEKGSWPNEKNLLKIAGALHVSLDQLLGYDPDLNNIQALKAKFAWYGYALEQKPELDEEEKSILARFHKGTRDTYANVSPPYAVSDSWDKEEKEILLFDFELRDILESVKNSEAYRRLVHQQIEIQLALKNATDIVIGKKIYERASIRIDNNPKYSQEDKQQMKKLLKEIMVNQFK